MTVLVLLAGLCILLLVCFLFYRIVSFVSEEASKKNGKR